MNEHRRKAPCSAMDQPFDALLPRSPLERMQSASIASDRLYQLAALTAGIFLLVSLL